MTPPASLEFADDRRLAQDPDNDVFWGDLLVRQAGEEDYIQVFVRFPGAHLVALFDILGWEDLTRDRALRVCEIALGAAAGAGWWGHELDAPGWVGTRSRPRCGRPPASRPTTERRPDVADETKRSNRRSSTITEGVSRTPNRAMLRAVGFGDDDFRKPIVGVASAHSTITPCNAGIGGLADRAIEGVRSAGGMPQLFGTITISDGISMGT